LQADIPQEMVGKEVVAEFYRMDGSLVLSERMMAENILRTQLNLSAGTYVLKLQSSDKSTAPAVARFVLIP
jgi:hypothetical protein